MRTLYLDIFSGISGDMFLGAILDLGVPLARIEAELSTLGVGGYRLEAVRARKSGIEGVKFDVHVQDAAHHGEHHEGEAHDESEHEHEHEHEHRHHGHAHEHHKHHEDEIEHEIEIEREHAHGHPHAHEHAESRTYAQIRDLIQGSALDAWVKARALAVFHRIAVAEGKIHGQPPEAVHFHEVGAIDSIVDVVGACVALNLLDRPRVLAGRVVDGTGFVACAHGRMPLPAPATMEILAARGIPVTQCEEPHELVTPTGAALLAEFAEHSGTLEGFAGQKVGYGLGTRNLSSRPNVLRAVLGEATAEGARAGATVHDWETDTIAVLETNLDDASPEILGHVVERALADGALDVFHTPVHMKKNRPGLLLTILCPPALSAPLSRLLLTETTAYGVRYSECRRRKLRRELRRIATPFGEVTLKLGWLDGQLVQASPEFESCRAVAAAAGVPLKAVYEAALASRPGRGV